VATELAQSNWAVVVLTAGSGEGISCNDGVVSEELGASVRSLFLERLQFSWSSLGAGWLAGTVRRVLEVDREGAIPGVGDTVWPVEDEKQRPEISAGQVS